MGKVSVIIPCYNVKREWLEECISSLINQTLSKEKLELIFVNDASTDDTLSVLLEYEKQYPDLMIVINLPENLRQGGAKNVGMEYASGDYIAFCDADDWVEPDMYESMLLAIESTNVECVCCGYWSEGSSGSRYVGPSENGLLDLSEEKNRNYVMAAVIQSGLTQTLYPKNFLVENEISFPEKLIFEDNFFGGLASYYVKPELFTEQ